MDSITQATLGALCGEVVLGRKLGNKGALWGALFGTLPDLDVLAYPFLSYADQLVWHRGISHSIFMMIIASLFFGWLMHKRYKKQELSMKRLIVFVFAAWSTHVWIDCFNSYGTQIFEPFSQARISINNISIIDPFFTLPIILGLLITAFMNRVSRKRVMVSRVVITWLCLYFTTSLVMKNVATNQFSQRLTDKGIIQTEMMTAPTFGNIFLWRMLARDEKRFYISYWSVFDQGTIEDQAVREFPLGHEIDERFSDSKDLKTIIWFAQGWHTIFTRPSEPDSIFIAALNMSEIKIVHNTLQGEFTELRPAFLWKVSKDGQGFTSALPFKLSTDGRAHIKKAVDGLIRRIKGDSKNWLRGTWSWNIY